MMFEPFPTLPLTVARSLLVGAKRARFERLHPFGWGWFGAFSGVLSYPGILRQLSFVMESRERASRSLCMRSA